MIVVVGLSSVTLICGFLVRKSKPGVEVVGLMLESGLLSGDGSEVT